MRYYSYASLWQGGGESGLSHGHTAAHTETEARGIAAHLGQQEFPEMVLLLLQVLEIELD